MSECPKPAYKNEKQNGKEDTVSDIVQHYGLN